MASKKGPKAHKKSTPKTSLSGSSKRATRTVKAASREVKKSAKQIARSAKTFKSAIKKVSKTLAKNQAKKAKARELAQINRLLGEDYQSLASARRALKRESKPVSEKTFKAAKNRVVKKGAKKSPVTPFLKYPHPATRNVNDYRKKHGILGINQGGETFAETTSRPAFQRAYEGLIDDRFHKDRSPRGRWAESLVDFGYRDEDADYDVGETPKEDAA